MERLLKPRSIAVIGGGAWCEAVVSQNRLIGFEGQIWPVHPKSSKVGGVRAYASLADLPGVPDAAFVGVNREVSVGIVRDLAQMGAGGAVCFASGFAETEDGGALSRALLEASGDMPVLGPNCYGALNALDRVALWPDQHGLRPVERGVAIVAQSSNIAINLTMQQRGLPMSYVVTAGNQLKLGLAEIGLGLLEDPRVTALGLYVESFGDVSSFEALAARASELGKRIVALKAGRSEEAQRATVSHTASLAGSSAGSDALMARLGIASASSLGALLECLKVFHAFGGLSGRSIASLSCSGGEASVVADAAERRGLSFPELTDGQREVLGGQLSGMVSLSNPLDYHTEIWRDQQAMTAVFSAMAGDNVNLTIIVLDFPRSDSCDASEWDVALGAVKAAARQTGRPFGVMASMGENLPEEVALDLMAEGIVPLVDFEAALEGVSLASCKRRSAVPVLAVEPFAAVETLSEGASKEMLRRSGLDMPRGFSGLSSQDLEEACSGLSFPVVLKGDGAAHKSEAGLVALGLSSVEAVLQAAGRMDCASFSLDEMIEGGVAEVLIGIVRDPAHGFVLTLGAGGILTELLEDQVSLLVPSSTEEVESALQSLRIDRILRGYRGKPAGNRGGLVRAIMALQSFVMDHGREIVEVEINPLIVTPVRVVAVDALIVKERP